MADVAEKCTDMTNAESALRALFGTCKLYERDTKNYIAADVKFRSELTALSTQMMTKFRRLTELREWKEDCLLYTSPSPRDRG
eukprot:592244-Amphidinium_carterae.1